MKYPKYSATRAIAKTGVNYVRAIVEASNSIFNEIHQENDIGIDAIIEIIRDEQPIGKCIGVQIKSGNSFYSEKQNECSIPIENHKDYWLKYPLPVYGIVFVPSKETGYWVEIKDYLQNNRNAKSITFECSRANTFDQINFVRLFVSKLLKEIPTQEDFTYDEALELFHSDKKDESYLGMFLLFRLFTDRFEVWDEFILYFRKQSAETIPEIFTYYLAHIPWHMDIWGGNDKITDETRDYGKKLIASFDKSDILKLLQLIGERGISRGVPGQSVEVLISIIPESSKYLVEIVNDSNPQLTIREYAAIIYAYHNQKTAIGIQNSMELFRSLSNESEIAKLYLSSLKQYHGIVVY